jgi:hypothetical protein
LAKEKYFIERIMNQSKDYILYIKDNPLIKKVSYKWKQKDNPNHQPKLSFLKKFKYMIKNDQDIIRSHCNDYFDSKLRDNVQNYQPLLLIQPQEVFEEEEQLTPDEQDFIQVLCGTYPEEEMKLMKEIIIKNFD